jgi:hypothetical protein
MSQRGTGPIGARNWLVRQHNVIDGRCLALVGQRLLRMSGVWHESVLDSVEQRVDNRW